MRIRINNRNYFGSFGNWTDVRGNFGGHCPQQEPKFVYAAYDIDGYDGSALVIVSRNGVSFRIAEASHCSCYGLEGQWTDKSSYGIRALDKMLAAEYGMFNEHRDLIVRWLRRVRRKHVPGGEPGDVPDGAPHSGPRDERGRLRK